MNEPVRLKDQYTRAKCCSPSPPDPIIGYFSFDRVNIKVHVRGCPNLNKAEQDRLVEVEWNDIMAAPEFKPDPDYDDLTELDWQIVRHHREYGVDYSLKVARVLFANKQAVFDSHAKLRKLALLERVKPLIIQYRKGIVDNKWIKHRNHTYYDLTEKGSKYLDHYLKERGKAK